MYRAVPCVCRQLRTPVQASALGLRIYLVIDEYDNFTNTILFTYGKDAYRQATHGEGFFRYFFNILKLMTTGNGMALERMFITGVSPITLDDMTSGFNIGSNFTTSPQFNSLVGFTETELRTMLEYYRAQGLLKMDVEEMIVEMKPWYDNSIPAHLQSARPSGQALRSGTSTASSRHHQ